MTKVFKDYAEVIREIHSSGGSHRNQCRGKQHDDRLGADD